MIRPSPALIVRAETSIAECVRMMREHDVGSVLVVSDDFKYELLGIFTERDLVKRIHLLQEGSHWNKAIAAVMTRKPITVELERLHDAPRIMLKNGFRHLPVVAHTPEGGPYLAGVVSMRDIFRDWAVEREGNLVVPPKSTRPAGPLRVFSDDPALLKLLTVQSWEIQRLETASELKQSLGGGRAVPLVLDADRLASSELGQVLKQILAKRPRPRILIAFNPAVQPQRVHRLLESLAAVRGILVFKRPLNLVALSEALSEFRDLARKRRT